MGCPGHGGAAKIDPSRRWHPWCRPPTGLLLHWRGCPARHPPGYGRRLCPRAGRPRERNHRSGLPPKWNRPLAMSRRAGRGNSIRIAGRLERALIATRVLASAATAGEAPWPNAAKRETTRATVTSTAAGTAHRRFDRLEWRPTTALGVVGTRGRGGAPGGTSPSSCSRMRCSSRRSRRPGWSPSSRDK